MIDYNELKSMIETGYDIEFSYKGKDYSITKTKQDYISFCEFYNEPTDFATVDDFMNNAVVGDEKLSEIWNCVTDLTY